MNKFGLSSQRVDVIIEQLRCERDRRALHILADFKAGMPPAEIASVNGFRKDHFDKVLKNIGELGLLKERELGFNDGKLPVYPTISERRCSPRVHSPLLVTKVYEVAAPERPALIMDLSERGLRTRGIKGNSDEKKSLFVNVSDFKETGNLEFECQCRWISAHNDPGEIPDAGFEITSISKENLGLLKTVVGAEFALAGVS